jgi:hypothetical protein
MIWLALRFASLVLFALPVAASGQDLFGKPTSVIIDFGQTVVDALRARSAIVPSDSVGQLVIDLGTLSGMELTLATTIEHLDQFPADNETKVYVLNQMLEKIKKQYRVIQADFEKLDKGWITKYASLGIDIGNFTHDGLVYYCIACVGGSIPLRPGQESLLASQVQSDVASIQKLAAALQAAAQVEIKADSKN